MLRKAGLVSGSLALALFLLAGCSLDCGVSATARTFLDQNENGVWDAGESPLPDVQCFMESSQGVAIGEATSDLNGDARLQVMQAGCPKGAVFWVYAEPPPGYRLTTLARLTGREPAQQPFLFGFVIPQQGSATPAATAGYAPVATATGTPLATPSSTPTRRPTRTPSPTPTPAPPTGTLLLASTPVASSRQRAGLHRMAGRTDRPGASGRRRPHPSSQRARTRAHTGLVQPSARRVDGVRCRVGRRPSGARGPVQLPHRRPQEIPIPYGVSVWGPAVDADGGRVAYTLFGRGRRPCRRHTPVGHLCPRSLHGTVTGFGADSNVPQDKSFFGGEPHRMGRGHSADRDVLLLLKATLGVWALDTGRGIPGGR